MRKSISAMLTAFVALDMAAATYYVKPYLLNTVVDIKAAAGASTWNTNTIYRFGTASGTMRPVAVATTDRFGVEHTSGIPPVTLVHAETGYDLSARPAYAYATGADSSIPLPACGLWTAQDSNGRNVNNCFTTSTTSAFAVQFDYDDTTEGDLGWHFYKWAVYECTGRNSRNRATSITISFVEGEGESNTTTCAASFTETFDDAYRYPIYWPVLAKNTYTVVFDANGGGEAPGSIVVTNGVAAVIPKTVPVRAGCEFLGWSLEEGGEVDFTAGGTNTFSATAGQPWQDGDEICCYAVWKVGDFNVELKVSPEGAGTVEGAGVYNVFDNFQATATPAKGWSFAGWAPSTPPVSIVSNSVYTAVFTPNTYTVAFDKNGGTGYISDQDFTYSRPQALTRNNSHITRTGYDFLGWALDPLAALPDYLDNQTVLNLAYESGGVVTLYAVWRRSAYQVEFKVSPELAGSIEGAVSGYWTGDEEITVEAVAARGYVFSKWSDGETNARRTVRVADDTSLVAHFVPAGYSVVFGEETLDLAWGKTARAPASSSGWAFAGGEAAAISGQGAFSNLTAAAGAVLTFYEAAAPVDTSIVSFTAGASPVEGGVVSSSILQGSYPTNVTVALTAAAADGWRFTGWSDGAASPEREETIALEDCSFTAIFEEIPPLAATVSATFDGANETTWESGDDVSFPSPGDTGLEFAGWWTSNDASGIQMTEADVAALLEQGVSGDFALVSRWRKTLPRQDGNELTEALGFDSFALEHIEVSANDFIAYEGGLKINPELAKNGTARLSLAITNLESFVFRYKTFKNADATFDETLFKLSVNGTIETLPDDTADEWIYVTNMVGAAGSEIVFECKNSISWGSFSGAADAWFEAVEWSAAPLAWEEGGSPAGMVPGDVAERTLEIDGPGVVSFQWKSTAAPQYVDESGQVRFFDELSFLVDGETKLRSGGLGELTSCAWTNTLEGAHVCTWRFERSNDCAAYTNGVYIESFVHPAAELHLGDSPFSPGVPEEVSAKRDFANVAIAPIPAQAYLGGAVEPAITATDGGVKVEASEYTLSYVGNDACGVATVTVAPSPDGSYCGDARTLAFTIFPGAMAGSFGETSFAYDGAAHTVEFTPEVSGASVVYYVDGVKRSSAPSFTACGSYGIVAVVEAANREPFAASTVATVSPCDISGFAVDAIPAQRWTGSPIRPAVSIASLAEGDYALAYAGNIAPGTAMVVIKGQGNYTGEVMVSFSITPPAVSLSFEDATFEYDGTVKSLAEAVAVPSWAEVAYSGGLSETSAGVYDITATGSADGYSSASASATLTITPRSISNVSIAAIPDQAWTGGAIEPAVVVSDTAGISSADYTLAYRNNVDQGTATVTLTGRGNYTGTKSATFKIVKSSTPEIPDDPDPVETGHSLVGDDSAAYAAGAAEKFNGYIYDSAGAVYGTVLLQIGKPNSRTGSAKATAKVSLAASTKKITLKGSLEDGAATLVGGDRAMTVELHADSFTGSFDGLPVEGSRNVFVSKSAADKTLADAALAEWKATYVVSSGAGSFSLAVGKKGAVKLKGVSAAGANVSATGLQMCLASSHEEVAIPVALPKLGIAFVVWADAEGNVSLSGIDGNAVRHDPSATFGKLAVRLADDFPAQVNGVDVVASLLPEGTIVDATGVKWSIPRGGNPKYVDGVFVPKNEANPANLKLAYTASTGFVKGTFAVYTAAEGAKRAKKTTVKVLGTAAGGEVNATAVIGGKAYGFTLE